MQPPNTTDRAVFEFGDFVLDPGQRRLLHRATGDPVVLTAKVLDTLLYLVEHRGQTLSKDRLLSAIWPGVVVEENSLTQAISTLRHTLGESRGENRYIATVPRQGYRFVADVIQPSPVSPRPTAPGPTTTPRATPRSRLPFWLGTALAFALLAGVTAVWLRSAPAQNPLSSVRGGTQDTDTYLLYASGRYALARSDEPSLSLAIDYFGKAIARDEKFALAHAGIADAYLIMGVFGMRAPVETFPRARDAALRALQIEPQLAPAVAALGHIKMQYDRDWAGAEQDFLRATQLDPALPEPRMYLGVLYTMRGDVEQGLAQIRDSQKLEPLLTLSKTRTGSMLFFSRRYDEAIAELTASIALDDRPAIAHRALGRVYLQTGRPELALAEFAKAHGISPGSYADVGMALASAGRRTEARAELDRVLELSNKRYVSSVDIAALHVSLGDTDAAISALERALDQRAPTLGFLAQHPAFDPLHDDPRFIDIVKRIGIWKRPLRTRLPAR
jgi:DNA-binding winged helix-turn-helix (wHTH) protein/tetratricopeptide (TPR) repeat protein